MRKTALSDAEYGYQLFLEEDRGYPEGHELTKNIQNLSTLTDTHIIRHIVDSYMDLSTDESIKRFSNYKLDFSENYLDAFCQIYKEKAEKAKVMLDEFDKQEADLSHLIIKSKMIGNSPLTDKKKLKIFNELEELYIKRRWVKDMYLTARVLLEHAEKSRNYVLGMNKRQYSPMSEKYGNDKEFEIPSVMKAFKQE